MWERATPRGLWERVTPRDSWEPTSGDQENKTWRVIISLSLIEIYIIILSIMYAKGSKELRKGRFSSGELPYFVTICSYKRKNISGITVFEAIRTAFGWLETNGYIKLFCFILMPDHIHAVFQLTGDKNLSEVVANLKISVWKQLRDQNESRKLWQRDFFDHRIRKNEQFLHIVFYCYNNPYRAGIINVEGRYPYWYCESIIQKELDKRIDFYRAEETEGNGFNPRRREG